MALRKGISTLAVVLFSVTAFAIAQVALPHIGFEAEAGTLAGGASVASDSGAGGGSFVSFFQQSIPGPIGQCGLSGEVFCENFESGPVANRLRSGDFDSTKISAARLSGTHDNSGLSWVRRALIPSGCRSGSVTDPLPPDDTLICEPTSSVNSRHGLTATAVQNYGDNYYRVNQPFDFANRTGIIRFDASIHHTEALWGGAAVTLIDEPLPSTSIIDENSNGAPPRNGLVIHFNTYCINDRDHSTLPTVRVYSNYTETRIIDTGNHNEWCNAPSALTQAGKMNRIELRVSQNKLEIWASDFSSDGVTFGALKNIYTSPAFNLPFSRGWFSFGGHNHATVKYGGPPSINVLWDNIAFDGPAITAPKAYQIRDNGASDAGGMSIGHPFRNRNETIMPALTFNNVQLSGSTSAKLTFNLWNEAFFNDYSTMAIYYRLNGGAWRLVNFQPQMVSNFDARGSSRSNHAIDIAFSDLINGNNAIQFASDNMNHSYPSYIANLDLILN